MLVILVSSGFDVDEYYNDGSRHYLEHNEKKVTCLHLAVKNHHYNAARWLVKHGAVCNKCSYEELPCSYMHGYSYITPITMLACHRNAPMDLFSKLKTTRNLNSYPYLPLHAAATYGHSDIAMYLIELGAKVNCMSRGTLPLHISVEHGHTELALSLIKHGASVNQNNRLGDLPLHIAVKHGHTETVLSIIRHGASVNQLDGHGDLPLHIAVEHGLTELALSLIKHGATVNQGDKFEELPLHIAVQNGHRELAVLLIKHGTSMNQKDRFGDVPLHIAVNNGRTEVALSLIKHGSSLKQTNRFGDTELHIAVKNGHTELAILLIKYGTFIPITYYIEKVNEDTKYFNVEIFTKLIPKNNIEILKTICQILEASENWDTRKESNLVVLSNMLHQLIQHLILNKPLSISIKGEYYFELNVNRHIIINWRPVKYVYLCSLLVILLRCNVSVVIAMVPSISTCSGTRAENLLQAHAIVDLLNAYKQKTIVRKLQTQCIQKTRQSMYRLIDESFQSLPVPLYVQKMLMLQDIADVLFEGWKMWPEWMSIEDLI